MDWCRSTQVQTCGGASDHASALLGVLSRCNNAREELHATLVMALQLTQSCSDAVNLHDL